MGNEPTHTPLTPDLVDTVRDLLREIALFRDGVRVESLEEAGIASANYGLLITAVYLGIEIRVESRDDLTVSISADTTGDVEGAEAVLPLVRAMAQFIERSWEIAVPLLKRMERG